MIKGLARRPWFGSIRGTIAGWLARPLRPADRDAARANTAPTVFFRREHAACLMTTFTYDAASRCIAVHGQPIGCALEAGDGIAPPGPAFALAAIRTCSYEA